MSAPHQLPLDFPVRTARGREDFLVAAPNQEAVAWIDQWPNWSAPVLWLLGPAASGKSHLATVFLSRAGGVWLEPGGIEAVLRDEAVRAVVLDPAEAFLEADGETQLFHLYNTLRDRGGHALLVTESPVASWRIGLADLKSRLMAAPVAPIHAPDDDLLRALFVKQFADRQMPVEEDVLRFLLPRMERSFKAVSDWVAFLDRETLARKRKVTIPLVRDLMDRET